jgi:hypothetical protein
MDIEQIKVKKMQTENDMRELLVKFSEETGLRVENIEVEMIDISRVGGESKVEFVTLLLDVRI